MNLDKKLWKLGLFLILVGMSFVSAYPPTMCVSNSDCDYLTFSDNGAYGGVVCNNDMIRPCTENSDCYPYSCIAGKCYSATAGQNVGTCVHNFDYDKDLVDSFGMICLDCFTGDGYEYNYNSPGSEQYPFHKKVAYQADAWTLKKVKWPTGETNEFYYEVDDWYTSRGDEEDPFIPTSKNYYLFVRKGRDAGNYVCNKNHGRNFGGGLKVASRVDCDGLGNCVTIHYKYEMYDSDIGCTRTSGAIGVVPFRNSWAEEYDARRPSHMGSKYTSDSVLYNRVKTILGDGSIGYDVSYYTTVDSTPENTDGALDTDAADLFPMDNSRDYDNFGSSAAIATNWKRGMEYKSQIYSADTSKGRLGLLSETKRTYSTKDNFKVFFGGIGLGGLNPLYSTTLSSSQKSSLDGYTDVYGGPSRYAYGYYSGTMVVDQIEDNRYGIYGADEYSTVVQNLETDPITGTPTRTLKTNFDGTTTTYRTDVVELAYQTNTDLEAKHMVAQMGSHKIYEGQTPGSNNLKSALVMTYADFDPTADKRLYQEATQVWNDLDEDGSLDAGELVTVSLKTDYDELGNVEVSEDTYGNQVHIVYDSYGRPIKGWNDEYGDTNNPAWRKTYYSSGLLESMTDENDMTTMYFYDSFGRSWVTVKQGDSIFKPTVQTVYHDYESSTSPRGTLTKTKTGDFMYAQTKEFLNGFGNLVQTQVKLNDDENDPTWLVTIIEYDSFNRKWKEYQPFEANTNGDYYTGAIPGGVDYTEYFYYSEPLLRVKKKVLANGGEVEYLYGTNNGVPTITVKDANNQVKRFTYDLFGNLIKVEEDFTGTISTIFP